MAATKQFKRVEFKDRKYDSETGEFEAHASIFGNVDSDDDIVEPGAFSKFLKEKGIDRVKILALHNDKILPIGKPLELREDDDGLYIKGKISDTAMGKDVRTLMKDKVLNEFSIGYIALDYYYDDDRKRHLTELALDEISLVTWAANEQARLLSIKEAKEAPPSPEALISIVEQLEGYAASLREQAARLSGGKAKKQPSSRKSYPLPGRISAKSRKQRYPEQQPIY